MARMIGKVFSRKGASSSPKVPSLSPEARQHMIGEAAYYRYVQRGYAPGHELEDWLAAEAEFDRQYSRQRALPRESAADAIEEFGMQQSGPSGPAQDDALKRILKQHPRRDIARINSIDPEDAPLKE